jgi:hypothetical protein
MGSDIGSTPAIVVIIPTDLAIIPFLPGAAEQVRRGRGSAKPIGLIELSAYDSLCL